MTNDSPPILEFSNSLVSSLCSADLPSSLAAAQKLAGLGIGLTPSGDDFIMGALHTAWILHPPEVAGALAREVANSAAPLTTSLSAAWIHSAGTGEAGELWHDFFDALIFASRIGCEAPPIGGNPTYTKALQDSFEKILSVGETSGADALSGFLGVLSHGGTNFFIDKTEHMF